MVHHQKQYSTMGMIDDKQNVKVKEGGGENMNRKEKKKQNKEEGDKKKEEKKMTKYKEEKERTRGNDKDNEKEKEKEDQRKRKENEKKKKARKEREEDKETDKEEESKERDAKEQNDKKHCPQFFRSLTTNSSMDQVTIPEDFHKYLEECIGVVSLRGPSGHLWPVELAKISGELCFAHGWKEFLCDHRIVYGYHLVFRYDGKSQFSVTVFLPSSCEAPYAFLAQPRRMDAAAVAAEDENGHTGTNADGTAPQEEDSHIGSGADGTPQNEGEEEDASEEYEGSDNMSVDADSTGPQEEEEDALSENPKNEEDSEWGSAPSQQQKEDRDQIHNGFVVGKRTRFRKVDDIMTEVVRSKKSKAKEGKRHEALSGDSESKGEALGDSLAKSERCPPRKSKAAEWKRHEAPSELVHCPPKKSKAGGKRSTALASKGAASSDSLAESERRPPRKSKAAKRKRPEAPCGHSESEGAESGDSLAELVRRPPKKPKAKGKRSAGPSASKGTTSSDSLAVHTGVFAPESICKDLTTLHKSFGNKHSMAAQFPMFNKSNKSENEPGRVVIKVKRMPELKSQRRPVTQRDKEDAMNRVRRFQSERPFVIKEMNHTNVYASGFMIIPDMFVENFLPKDSRKMTLWDPQAKPWKVWYEYTGGECPRAAFSAGWGALAMENNLEKWDVCIFELLDQKYNVKLHVYRAVLEITPCVIAPKHRPQGCA